MFSVADLKRSQKSELLQQIGQLTLYYAETATSQQKAELGEAGGARAGLRVSNVCVGSRYPLKPTLTASPQAGDLEEKSTASGQRDVQNYERAAPARAGTTLTNQHG